MPVNWKNYPTNWKAIAGEVKSAANWTCQQCGRPCRKPGQLWSDFVFDLMNCGSGWYGETREDGKEKVQRFTLTVAHLDHDTTNSDRANLKALCSGCHLKYDAALHAKNAAATRKQKQHPGQISLLEVR